MRKKAFFIVLVVLVAAGFWYGTQILPGQLAFRNIENAYSGISTYRVRMENRLEKSPTALDQAWDVVIEKPNRWKKVHVIQNDKPVDPPSFEICNEDDYLNEKGQVSDRDCNQFVEEFLGVPAQLSMFRNAPKLYNTSLTSEKEEIRFAMNLKGDASQTTMWFDPETYLLRRIEYVNPQSDGSITRRTVTYRNHEVNGVVLGSEFSLEK